MTTLLQLEGVERRYRRPGSDVLALAGVSLSLDRGQMICLKGPSGCGKSSLLLAAGGMLRPTAGAVRLEGDDLYALSAGARARRRRDRIGFVFQLFHLLPYLSVRDNILLGAASAPPRAAAELAEELGLGARLRHRPDELSAGERQRVALARAVLSRPPLLLADEPTGNLDPDNEESVIEFLARYRDEGGAVLIVTHGSAADSRADRVLRMVDGALESPSSPNPGAVA